MPAAGNKRRWFANLLLAVGIVLVGVCAWWMLRGAIYQHWGNLAFERKIQERKAPEPHGNEPAPVIHDGDVVGRLIVPRLHLRAMVREGAGKETLDVALGHIPGTAFPDQRGNVGIAGHRDTLFRSLRDIRKSDLIEFQTLSGSYLYQVGTTEIVTPQSVDVLKAGQVPEMTLVTCYPFRYVGPAPDRFIVKAHLISRTPGRPAEAAATLVAASDSPKPAPPNRAAVKTAPKAAVKRVAFRVAEKQSRELAPGISFGLTWADANHHRVTGWMWVLADRRTIWLRNQGTRDPVVFYGHRDGKQRQLVITGVGAKSVTGYLVVPNS